MSTLFQATLDLAYILTDVIEGDASSNGTTTTLIDTAWPRPLIDGTLPANDTYNRGTIWLTSGDNDGNSRIISDWTQSSGTVTWVDALSNATAAGDAYSAIDGDYPRDVLRRSVNRALQELPNAFARDVSKTSVADAETISLPAGVHNVKQLWIATRTSGDDLAWMALRNWFEEQSSVGTNVLRFYGGGQPRSTGYTYCIWYQVPPTALTTDAGTISDYIHPDLLSWTAAVHALRWRIQRTKGGNAIDAEVLKEAMLRRTMEKAKHMHLIPSIQSPPKPPWISGGPGFHDPSYEINKVIL